jgi:hypothetical protein
MENIMLRRIGVSKYGFKLEDFDSHADYTRAIRKAYNKTAKGKLSLEKGALKRAKYLKTKEGKLARKKVLDIYKKTEKYKLGCKNYRQGKGRLLKNSLQAKRRASKLQRTVPWADLKAIKEFYANCPKGYAVDHIIPLQGTTVSGLHVLNNLQYLTPTQNSRKGNKYGHQ